MKKYKFIIVVESDVDPESTAKIIKLNFNGLPWISMVKIRKIKYMGEDK